MTLLCLKVFVKHFGCQCMNILYLEIWEKTGIFQLTYQLHSSSVDC